MLFNSYVFICVFLPIVLAGYIFALKHSHQVAMAWLLISSLFFYGWWNPIYIWLIVISLLFNYRAGIFLNRNSSGLALFITVGANLCLLSFYKYTEFLASIWGNLSGFEYTIGAIILPLGISFYTFQTLSYTIDVYRGHLQLTFSLNLPNMFFVLNPDYYNNLFNNISFTEDMSLINKPN